MNPARRLYSLRLTHPRHKTSFTSHALPASSLVPVSRAFAGSYHPIIMPRRSKDTPPEQTPTSVDGEGEGSSNTTTTSDVKLPPLTVQEFKTYNSMAVRMEYFHDRFRQTWNLLWKACTTNKRPQGMTIRQFLDRGLMFCEHLHMHHSIEERAVFPMLGRRMPEFRGDLQGQHKQIHKGLDAFAAYLRECKSGEADLDLSELRGKMETWGPVLLEHLDDEVRALGAENMRKYWTADEVQKMGM